MAGRVPYNSEPVLRQQIPVVTGRNQSQLLQPHQMGYRLQSFAKTFKRFVLTGPTVASKSTEFQP